jgi:hypothetical protein
MNVDYELSLARLELNSENIRGTLRPNLMPGVGQNLALRDVLTTRAALARDDARENHQNEGSSYASN